MMTTALKYYLDKDLYALALHTDGTRHYLKQIPAYGNRWLRLIINMTDGNPVCVTLFFDRRLRKKS